MAVSLETQLIKQGTCKQGSEFEGALCPLLLIRLNRDGTAQYKMAIVICVEF